VGGEHEECRKGILEARLSWLKYLRSRWKPGQSGLQTDTSRLKETEFDPGKAPRKIDMRNSSVSLTDVCALSIFGLINALVVYKYSSRIISQSWTASLLYLVLFGLFVWILYRNIDFRLSSRTQNLIYLSLIIISAICLAFLMFHFDPEKIRVGRYPAIHDWLTMLFHSQFPYASPTRPSGFPFLFLMAPILFFGRFGSFADIQFLDVCGSGPFETRARGHERISLYFPSDHCTHIFI
jgi:TRAP-type uncharacterized transport system fused permease subunit